MFIHKRCSIFFFLFHSDIHQYPQKLKDPYFLKHQNQETKYLSNPNWQAFPNDNWLSQYAILKSIILGLTIPYLVPAFIDIIQSWLGIVLVDFKKKGEL